MCARRDSKWREFWLVALWLLISLCCIYNLALLWSIYWIVGLVETIYIQLMIFCFLSKSSVALHCWLPLLSFLRWFHEVWWTVLLNWRMGSTPQKKPFVPGHWMWSTGPLNLPTMEKFISLIWQILQRTCLSLAYRDHWVLSCWCNAAERWASFARQKRPTEHWQMCYSEWFKSAIWRWVCLSE